uniref:Uncharacterized protein n=1 Tax=Zeugodacus cucurbitae TaxID=28588 RepID=A0A0A1X2Q0_ZEUCU
MPRLTFATCSFAFMYVDIIIFMCVDLLSPASRVVRFTFGYSSCSMRSCWPRCLSTRLNHPPTAAGWLQSTCRRERYKAPHTSARVRECVCVCYVCMRAAEQQWHAKLPSSTSTWATKEPSQLQTSQPTKQAEQASDCVHCEHCTFYCCASNKLKAFPRDLLTAHARTHQPTNLDLDLCVHDWLCVPPSTRALACVCVCARVFAYNHNKSIEE